MKYRAIEDAVKMTNDYLETIGANESTIIIYKKVASWYEFTDIVSPYILSALAMRFGNEVHNLPYDHIIDITLEYYPELVFIDAIENHTSAWEIEASEHDMIWR
jgi:hypothetical protein